VRRRLPPHSRQALGSRSRRAGDVAGAGTVGAHLRSAVERPDRRGGDDQLCQPSPAAAEGTHTLHVRVRQSALRHDA
jgi:hypothetical protein